MVFVMFMLGVGFRSKTIKPRPNSDLTLGIGLEVLKISWQVILMNLFLYYVMVISPITCRASAAVGLDGSARKPYLLKRCSLNLESFSSACSSSSNFFLREFLNSSWRIWCFRFFWIRLYLLFLGGSSPFTLFSTLMSHSLRFWCSGSWCLALLVRWTYCNCIIYCLA